MKGLLALMLVLSLAMSVDARAESSPQSLRVFLDCRFCDSRFIKDELPIVDFLNERTQADVHILHASQRTGAGGRRITLTFLGQRDYVELSDTFDYATRSDATRDDRRRALLHHLTIGLSRYLAHAGLGDKLTISAVRPSAEELPASSIEDDPWDYWVFSFGGGGSVNGQETTRFTSQRANFSADRTTEALKIRVNGNMNESKREVDVGDETIVSKNNTDRLSAQVVKSIGEQWAVGATTSVSSSSFRNTERQMEIGPTIEYDFFPYSQSTRRLLTVQ